MTTATYCDGPHTPPGCPHCVNIKGEYVNRPPTDAAAVEAFHRARRMFAVTRPGVAVAEVGDPRGHMPWLESLLGAAGWAETWVTLTRGYVLGERMVAYRGDDFSADVPRSDVLAALAAVEAAVGPVFEIGLGVVPAPGVVVWPPRFTYRRVAYAPAPWACRACNGEGSILDPVAPGASPVCPGCLGGRVAYPELLALPAPPCRGCGGSRQVFTQIGVGTYPQLYRCPDCDKGDQ